MRKTLSLILAVAMIFAMLPSGFVSAEAVAAGIEHTYAFGANTIVPGYSGSYINMVASLDNWNPNASGKGQLGSYYEAASESSAIPYSGSDKWAFVGKRTVANYRIYPTYTYISHYAANCTADAIANNDPGFIIKIDVAEDGFYQPVLEHWNMAAAAKYEIFLVDTSYGSIDSAFALSTLTDVSAGNNDAKIAAAIDKCKAKSAGESLGVVECYQATGTNKDAKTYLNQVELKAGTYYLVFSLLGYSQGADTSASPTFYIENLKLTPVVKDELTGIGIAPVKAELEIGEYLELEVTGKYSVSGDKVLSSGITYKSENTDIATVSDKGIITAVSAGTVKITATADGTDLSSEMMLTVLSEDQGNAGLTFSYVTNTNAMADQTVYGKPRLDASGVLRDFSDVDELNEIDDTVSTPWSFGTYSGYSINMSRQFIYSMVRTDKYETNTQPFLVLKLKVPNRGDYNLMVEPYTQGYGTSAKIYMVSALEGTPDRELINKAQYIGDADFSGTLGAEAPQQKVGKVSIPKRGEYYIIFDCFSDNETVYESGSGSSILHLHSLILEGLTLEACPGDYETLSLSVTGIENGGVFPMATEKQLKTLLCDRAGVPLEDVPESEITKLFTSSDESVATVSESGKLSAVGTGDVTITASVEYDNKKVEETFGFTVAPMGENLMEDLNHNFSGDSWVWSLANETEEPESPKFMRVMLGTEEDGNRALKFVFDGRVAAVSNPSTLMLKRGIRVEGVSGGLYSLKFKFKADYTVPAGASDMALYLDLLAFTSPTASTSEFLAYNSERSINISKIANWRELYDDWYEVSVPIAAPTMASTEVVYLTPRIIFRPDSSDLAKAGFEGEAWFDDFELREVGFAGVDFDIEGDTTGTSTALKFSIKPYSSTGEYLSLGSAWNSDDIVFRSDDKNVIGRYTFASLLSAGEGSGMNIANASASLLGKNASATVFADVTINGITRTGSKRIDVSGFPIKLLYATLLPDSSEIEAGSNTTLLPTGYLSDGTEADMSKVTVVYKSLTPDVLTVNEDGVVTGISAGKGKIKATLLLDGNATETETEISVTDSSAIKTAELKAPATVGYLRDEQLVISGTTENGFAADISSAEIEWVVDCDIPGGITVDENGKVFGHEYGAKAEIYAIVTLNSGEVATNTIEIVVAETDMRDVEINFTKASQSTPAKVTIEEDGWCLNLSETSLSAQKAIFNTNGLVGYTRNVGDKISIDVNIPYSGVYQPIFTGTFDRASAFESSIYIDGIYVGKYVFYGKDVNAEPERLRTIKLDKGTHTVTFVVTEKGTNYSYQTLKTLRFANRRAMPEIESLTVGNDAVVICEGDSSFVNVSAEMSDGTVVPCSLTIDGNPDPYMTVTYESENNDIATISENGEIKASSEGETTVTVKVLYNGETCTKEISVKVLKEDAIAEDGKAVTLKITAPYFVMSPEHSGITLTAEGINSNTETVEIPSGEISWSSENEEVFTVSDNGIATPVGVGSARVFASIQCENGLEITGEAIITVREGKTTRTIYTDEMVSAARENIGKYSWAKEERDAAVQSADKFLSLTDELWLNVAGQNIPRSNIVGYKNDPDCYLCRYCGTNLYSINGNYPWSISPLSRRWKIQCPDCKRVFPSNDFESFYKLGCTEENKGEFDLQTALDAHMELFGDTYGTGYLKNTLYPEVGTNASPVKLTSGESAETWGVDDSTGYKTGRTYSNGVPEVHTYVAYYNHMATWFASSNDQRFVMGAVNSLSKAYLYTGDEKYGRVGAILLDRVADIYPSLDLRVYPTLANTNGGIAKGKAVGSIWETYVTEEMARAYDMLFPMYDDAQVIKYISDKAHQYGIDNKFDANGNVTPETIRKSVEDGVCREIYKASVEAQNQGNFGLHQLSVTLAGVALDCSPETDEMLDWVFGHSDTDNRTYNTGGGVNEALVSEVTRDGQGTESPQYNLLWVTQLIDIATTLANYDDYNGMALFNNPKYVGMIKSYAPLTLVKRGLATIGDSGFAVHFSPMPDDYVLLEAFKYTGDIEIAQHLYMLKDNDVSELHYDIFTKNPESIADEIEGIIRSEGEYDYDKSSMLTGFGFAALRGGTLYDVSGNTGIRDSMRDFTIYFGGAASHSHNDMLNLGIDAYGIGMTTDLGYPEVPSATDPNRHQWITPTISHNTVVVNEQSQNKTEVAQKPLHFDAKETRVKVMDVEAPEAYGECDEYRRTVVMVDYDSEVSYGIDFFRVLGGSDHLYSFHANSETHPETSDNLVFEEQIGGTYAGASVPFGPDPYTNTSSPYAMLKYPLGYTWLFDVHRADNPKAENFYIDYEIKDFRNHSRNPDTDMRLRMTMVNDFEADEVTLASGLPTRIAKNEVIDHLEYMLVRRKGKNLDTLFTTVIEPYNKVRYIKDDGIKRIDIEPDEQGSEIKRSAAVKVELCDGRCDYIVYAQDNSKLYIVTDPETGYTFKFRGFVGVWSINADGVNIYSYVNDGDMIGTDDINLSEVDASVGGIILDFQKELSFDNWVDVEFDRKLTQTEADALVDRMINMERKTPGNSSFMIKGVEMTDATHGRISFGEITTIAGYIDASNESLGYEYDVAAGKAFAIPMSYENNEAPVFDKVADLTASAGSSISVKIHATAESDVTYSARTLPRGASFDEKTGEFRWNPTASQIGANLVAIDARDELGRISTQYFTITVYGSTTGGGGGTSAPSIPDTPVIPDKPETPGTPSTPETSDNNVRFVDLGTHAWAEDAINSLAAKGIVKGTTENTYSPAANITRADFAILLVRAFKLASDNSENFDDVLETDYFARELAIARNTGIVNGIGDNKYAPRNTITRQDMMVIVYRALLKLGVELESTDVVYADFAEVSDYAKEAVSALVAEGLTNGRNGKIAPNDFTTRAEVAVLIKRIMEKLQ
ncbi:MAG: Ig-like domain-containing protein [Oscillospiraceae bacterium]|nr:Ig-like domain-containing protein [Oscillospiraceae bacterium]